MVRLFGPFFISLSDGAPLRIPAGRQKTLMALLASAPDMRRNRAWLIDKLWSDCSPQRGRANLRQLLYAIKQSFGDAFDDLFEVATDTVGFRPGRIELRGSPEDGELLEGFDMGEEGFEEWLRDQRASGERAVARFVKAAPADPQVLMPRIVVLPFGEIAEDDRRGIGDAMAHEITSGFARSQLIDAISHFSARTVAGVPGTFEEAVGQLNADYAVTGQCRLLDNTLTVSVALNDMSDRRVIWSESHRIGFQSFLAGDESLVGQVVGGALRLIMSRTVAANSTKPIPEMKAHRLMISGVSLMHSFEHQHFQRAEDQLRELARRCPNRSEPLAWLAQWHLLRIFQKWSPNPAEDQRRARDTAAKALDLNPSCPLSLAIDGNIYTVLDGDFTKADRRFSASQGINPSSAMTHHLASVLETFRGNGTKAVKLAERGYALSPCDPRQPFFQTLSAGSYVVGGQYRKAVEMAEASLRINPRHLSAHRCRVIGLQLGGRGAEARAAATELLQVDPGITVANYLRDHPTGQSDLGRKLGRALREAGIPNT
ncbi:MAG: hypothetical protein AAGL24_10705 [Pseudomonadota bacterium]